MRRSPGGGASYNPLASSEDGGSSAPKLLNSSAPKLRNFAGASRERLERRYTVWSLRRLLAPKLRQVPARELSCGGGRGLVPAACAIGLEVVGNLYNVRNGRWKLGPGR